MKRSLSLPVSLLLAALLLASLTSSASAEGDVTIPLDRYVNLSNGLTVQLIQITISNVTYGGANALDPNSVFPILIIKYHNFGNYRAPGRLHVQFRDNASTVYDKKDYTIIEPIFPNSVHAPVMIEVAMPKSRKLTNLTVIDDDIHKTIEDIPIVYPTPTPTPGPASVPPEEIQGDDLRNLLIIPILLGIVGLVGWYIAKKRIF